MKREDGADIKQLFNSDESKIKAFDFFFNEVTKRGFGSINKADYDLLLFSIVLDRLYESSNGDYNKANNYNVSKLLGITQTRVSSFKEKKELTYPSSTYDWKKVFEICLANCYFDGKNIIVQIPDKTTYLELKNIIDTNGGFVEKQLTSNLLCVKPGYFLDLLINIYDDDIDKTKEMVIKAIKDNKAADEDFTLSEFEKAVEKISNDNFLGIFECLINKDIKGALGNALKVSYDALKK